MEKVNGVILRAKLSKEMTPSPEKMSKIAESLIDTFVELHNVDYKAVGLDKIGKPDGYIDRQIDGWARRYQKSKTNDIPEMDQIIKWLSENKPSPHQPTMIHNDFKYDNLILDENDWTKVKVVLDWEMATIGDPLMDLGTTLGYWMNHNDPDFMKQMNLNPTSIPGNPTREELAHMYALKSGRNIDDIIFYYVYGVFKIAVIIQQIYFRYKKGLTQDKRFKNLLMVVQMCSKIATQAIHKKKLDQLF